MTSPLQGFPAELLQLYLLCFILIYQTRTAVHDRAAPLPKTLVWNTNKPCWRDPFTSPCCSSSILTRGHSLGCLAVYLWSSYVYLFFFPVEKGQACDARVEQQTNTESVFPSTTPTSARCSQCLAGFWECPKLWRCMDICVYQFKNPYICTYMCIYLCTYTYMYIFAKPLYVLYICICIYV